MPRFDRASSIVVPLATVLILLAVAFVALHILSPFDGARLQPGGDGWRADGVVVAPLRADADGLQAADVVTAVDGRSIESWARLIARLDAPRPAIHVGDTVTYTVERDGRPIDVPVTLDRYPFAAIVAREWGTILFAVVSFLIAALVILRRPADPAARVWFLWAASILAATTWSFGLHVGDIISGIGFWLFKATTFGAYMVFWIAGLHFTLIFPQPHPLIKRYTWLIPALYVGPFAIYPLYLAVAWPGSASVLDWLGRWILGEGALAAIYLVAMIAGNVSQYRLSRGSVARQKIRWVVFAGLVSSIGGLCLWNLPALVLGSPIIGANALGLLVLPFPVAVGIAIVRHQLFDIDRILSRTLVYGGLTTAIVAIYVLTVGYLGAVFNARGNLAISLIATGVVAVLFQPLRDRLQGGVNRLIYGERDDPYAVISRLGQRIESTRAPDAVLHMIAQTVRESLKLPYVAIAQTTDDGQWTTNGSLVSGPSPIVAEAGTATRDLVSIPLTYQHESVGQLLLAPREPGEPFAVADQRLLDDLARQAGIAVHAINLTRDLQHSRERLVTAREEERRRLRRDLHDGLGPTLASLTMKLDTAQALIADDIPAGLALLSETKAQMQGTIANVRRLVYALRPPVLDQFGLGAALREHALQMSADGLSIEIDAPEQLPPLPAAVEVAAYYIGVEALTNVVRHARARHCTLRLGVDEALKLEIADDGYGIPGELRAGVGLQSMRERAAELGGSCVIEPIASGGTCVRAVLPLL